jgi:hypothetical protein
MYVHFKPQYMYFQKDRVDYVGRIEDCETSIKDICEIMNWSLPKTLPHLNQSNKVTKTTLTPHSIEIIKNLYREDFKQFRYDPSSM